MSQSLSRALRLLPLALVLVVGAACSRQDPSTLAPEGGYPERAADSRPLVADVTALSIEPTLGGGILRVTGVADSQGWWNIGLQRDTSGDATPAERQYNLRGRPPVDAMGARLPTATSPLALREIDAAIFLSDRDLAGVRRITVTGANSSRTLRR